jgi:hypothetical protein
MPNNPRAAGTTADMIMRDSTDGAYRLYNLGNNKNLTLDDPLLPLWAPNSIGIGTDWDFAGSGDSAANPTAVAGAVEWDFAKNMQDIFLRNKVTGNFAIYNVNVSTNTLAGSASLDPLGNPIGKEWQVVGFGYLNGNAVTNPISSGQADMILSRANANNTTTYQIYDTVNNQFTTVVKLGDIGSNWKALGIGEYVDFKTFAGLMVVRTDSASSLGPANTILAYAIVNNQLVTFADGTSFSNLPATGLDFVGFGHFSSQFALGVLMRDSNPTSTTVGQMRIYDISQVPTTGKYTWASPDSNIIITGSKQLGVDWKPVGIAPMSGVSSSDDLIMRQDGTGAMLVYDIRDDKIVPGSGTTFLPANSVPTTYKPAIGGDFFMSPSAGSTSQLVQAMAGFGGSSGAADGLNTAPLGADTSQSQSFLTTPQHA